MGEILLICYCSREIGYCFPEIFLGDKALMEGEKFVIEDDIPPVYLHCGNPVNALKKRFLIMHNDVGFCDISCMMCIR